MLVTLINTGAQMPASEVADSLYAQGNYTKAINEYAKIGTAAAALQIARSYNAIGNFDKAVANIALSIRNIQTFNWHGSSWVNCC